MNRLKQRKAFTMLELLISLFIVAMITGASVPLVNSIMNVNLKTSTQKLSGNIKYLFDRATLERLYIRLVIDLDNNVYWSESTKDPFFLSQKPIEVEDGGIVVEEEEDEEDDPYNTVDDILFDDPENYKWQGWTEFVNKFKTKKAAFKTYKTELTNKTKLPNSVQLYKAQTQNILEPVEKGTIYIHFFPNGFVERAMIQTVKTVDIEDDELLPEEMEIYTIMVEPLTGRSTIYDYKFDMPEVLEDEETL